MIHIILGTKAQLIKMAPVMKELADRNIGYNFIFTGQHKETIKELMEVFKLKPPGYTLYDGADITKISRMFFWIFKCLWQTVENKKIIFTNEKGIVLIHGDTVSTILGALMAKINGLKISYVEAGLRSFNLLNPFPEEIVRRITSRLADYHFCPGDFAFENSRKYKGKIINTKENTLLDSLKLVLEDEERILVNVPEENYCLVSLHRFENIFNKARFSRILETVKKISGEIKVLFILHKPTKQKLAEYGFFAELENNLNIELRPRYDYFQFIKLLKNSDFIITDGGSNQEESYYLGKPCLIMRKTTERKEGLGKNAVVSGYDRKIISNFIADYRKHKLIPTGFDVSPSKIIVDYVEKLN